MSLTIRLKPDEKIIIGGAVIKNGRHSSELHVENQVPILRRKDIMSETEAITLARQIYFEIQLMYIDSERRDIHSTALVALARTALASKMSGDGGGQLLSRVLALVEANDFYHALKVARDLIALEAAQAAL